MRPLFNSNYIPLQLGSVLRIPFQPLEIGILAILHCMGKNKYAIYAYTHGPVTGSGPSVKPLKYDVAPY